MSVPHLSVVQSAKTLDNPSARANRLFAEAREAALEQVNMVGAGLGQVIALAAEIADGGEIYPAGVRDLCRRLGEELTAKSQTLESLAARGFERR